MATLQLVLQIALQCSKGAKHKITDLSFYYEKCEVWIINGEHCF